MPTPKQKLKQLFEIKGNTPLALFRALEALEALKTEITETFEVQKEELAGKTEEAMRIISGLELDIQTVEKQAGPEGKAGADADEDKIFERLVAKIPPPKKGDKGEPGRDADEKAIEERVISRIPTPKDGKTPVVGVDFPLPEKGDKGDKGDDGKGVEIENLVELFKPEFEKLRKQLLRKKGGSGGGMGSIVHQVFDGDDSTTSFTLSSNVAAAGNAIWVRYQGQMLTKDVHYTISGKTLNTAGGSSNFTAESGTNIDVTYVRT